MKEYSFKSSDGQSTIHCIEWAPEGKPTAVLQIVHGMSEYVARYSGLAEYLNTYGILVVGHDHIGHGQSAEPKDWGYFGKENGWLYMIDDVEKHRQIISEKYKDVPYFVMGHSMGSFVTRCFVSKYGQGLSGAIFLGTAGTNPAVGAGSAIVSLLRKLKGDRHQSGLVTAMAFGSYLKKIENKRTAYDWLSCDESIVDAHVADPACGFTFSLAGYADLFNLIKHMNSGECYKGFPKDIKYLLVAGEADPVGEYGKGPTEVAAKLCEAGCGNVELKLYPKMRHEILNEFGKEEVYEDIRKFMGR